MSAQQSKPFSILWIEDEYRQLFEFRELLQTKLAERLKCEGDLVRFPEAPTVEAAEAVLEKMKNQPPDVILLDLILPIDEAAAEAKPPETDMNAGYLLWYQLRRQKQWGEKMARVPIVVLTGRGNPEFRPTMEESDKLAWIQKPALASEVASAILELVGASERGSSGDAHEPTSRN